MFLSHTDLSLSLAHLLARFHSFSLSLKSINVSLGENFFKRHNTLKKTEKKVGSDMPGARTPSPTAGLPAQGSSARNISTHNFRLQKPAGIESAEETAGASSSSS